MIPNHALRHGDPRHHAEDIARLKQRLARAEADLALVVESNRQLRQDLAELAHLAERHVRRAYNVG